MRTVPQTLENERKARTKRYCRLWTITRLDSTAYNFTDHDVAITVAGTTFTPANGMEASAKQDIEGLRPQNFSAMGIVNSNAIDDDDFRKGLFRGATVWEYVRDWRYPFGGVFSADKFEVIGTRWNGHFWEVSLEGVLKKLTIADNELYTRDCPLTLGSTGHGACKVNLATFTKTGETVSSVTTQRRIFQTSITGWADDYASFGKLTWTSGNNHGLVFNVRGYASTNGVVTLQEETPADIAASDAFTIVAGCDKLWDTCDTKFSNTVNYGGAKFIPGNKRTFFVPTT